MYGIEVLYVNIIVNDIYGTTYTCLKTFAEKIRELYNKIHDFFNSKQ